LRDFALPFARLRMRAARFALAHSARVHFPAVEQGVAREIMASRVPKPCEPRALNEH
jgi:hypothetical protein